MKLWKVLMRKSAKANSHCKNCNKFDDNSTVCDDDCRLSAIINHNKNNNGYCFDNQSNSMDFTTRINEQFDRKIFLQHDLQSLANYSLSKNTDDGSVIITTKITNVMIDCSDGTLGITLKGTGFDKSLVISHITPHGSVFRNGLVQTGDRLLQVDDHPLHLSDSLIESKRILQNKLETCPKFLMLTIEYNVNILKSIELSSDAFLVEIQRTEPQFKSLGLILNNDALLSHQYYSIGCCPITGIYIDHILSASLSDRCGALKVGDRILTVDNIEVDQLNYVPSQVVTLIDHNLQQNGYVILRVLPKHLALVKKAQIINQPNCNKFKCIIPRKHHISTSSNNSCSIAKQSTFGHTETLTVSLNCDSNFDYGLSIIIPEIDDLHPEPKPLINLISLNSPAYLSGCIQCGDRIKSINAKCYFSSLDEINSILSKNENLLLEIEFDIADTVIPASGIFTVKIARIGPDLGFTISSNKNGVFTITYIRKGSAAYRTGILNIGDRLLAINDSLINQLNFEQLMNLVNVTDNSSIDNVQDPISLRVQKFEQKSDFEFTIDLCNTTPLGITISGSEDCTEPITLARLTKDGPAERTGKLKIGDQIVAINNISILNKPLSEAINLLKTSEKTVNLKLVRKYGQQRESSNMYSRIFYSDEDTDDNFSLDTDEPSASTSDIADIYQVQLTKDVVYDDYGFSVSDGLYKKGVYINRIRKGGPADYCGILKRFDRIIQVNDVNTKDFDCCLTVPLIASAGEQITLLISRSQNLTCDELAEMAVNTNVTTSKVNTITAQASKNSSNSTISSLTFIL